MYKKNNENLKQSFITPPSWVFGIVWPILYSSMVIYFLLQYFSKDYMREPLIFFSIQTILNLLWPYTFFRLKELSMSLVLLILMDILTFATIIYTNNNYKYILYPYMIWISFATYLNFYIVINN